jgi:Na+-driven multidrug efflux pump
MDVTLAGALVTAALDPAFIFGLHLGLEGAAISTICLRLVIAALGWHGVTQAHALIGPIRRTGLLGDSREMLTIAAPVGPRDLGHDPLCRLG